MKNGDLLQWYPAEQKPWPSKGNMAFWCPGCQEEHAFKLNYGHNWNFNGNFESPTFSPSLLIFETQPPYKATKCHLILADGVINFCSDSNHSLAGKSVKMIPWDETTNYWKGVLE